MLTIRKVYKAANWIPLGLTKGYSRVNRQERDFFIPNERPKAVWVYPLAKDAVETLNAPTLPATCEAGAHGGQATLVGGEVPFASSRQVFEDGRFGQVRADA